MYLRNSGFAPRRRQGGFIQGAILFALVIIAVVVAAFSLANRDSQNNADSEQAKVNSTFLLKVGNDLQSGINRAIADGANPANITTQVSFGPSAAVTAGTALDLFDTTLRYVARPAFPATALQVAATVPTISWATSAAITGVGDPNRNEAIMQISNIALPVCQRINNTANGTLVTAAPPATVTAAIALTPAWREGCIGDTTNGYSYFRAVVTDIS